MNFIATLEKLTSAFHEAGVRYALISGFAMAMRGVQRATVDLDFILLLEDLEKAHRIFEKLGYERSFTSENVSHYFSSDSSLGRMDLLHAFRGPTLSMLERADRLEVTASLHIQWCKSRISSVSRSRLPSTTENEARWIGRISAC